MNQGVAIRKSGKKFGHIHCVNLGWIVRGRKLVFKIALALAERVLVNSEGKWCVQVLSCMV